MDIKSVVFLIALISLSLSYCHIDHKLTVELDKIQFNPIGEGFPHLKVKEVNDFPTGDTFFQNHVLPGVPLVIRGGAKISPAFTKWTDDYFLSLNIPKNDLVEVEMRKKEDRNATGEEMHMHDFLRKYNTSDIYMVQDAPVYLKKDLVMPCMLRCPGLKYNEAVIWFSSGGTSSVLHNDNVDNLNCLYRGNKSLLMIDTKYMHYFHLDNIEHGYSTVDVDSVDYSKYPGLAKVEYYNVSMFAGDCLYIPFLWAHQVRSFGSNLAVNIWWDHGFNRRIELAKCDKLCTNDMRFSDYTWVGLEDISDSLSAQNMIEYLTKVLSDNNGVPIDTISEYFTIHPMISGAVPTEMLHLVKPTINEALGALDKNKDSILTADEVSNSSERDMEALIEVCNEFSFQHSHNVENVEVETMGKYGKKKRFTDVQEQIIKDSKDEL